jgi:primosomal protein N' (replication factor Y)
MRRRASGAFPDVATIDVRGQPLRDGVSARLFEALRASLARGEQSLVFINRRGYAPTLACRACGWASECHRCAARLVLHARQGGLRCHHCGHRERPPAACPSCGNQDLAPLGQGTQRIEEALAASLPDARILRIDRDTTRRKDAWGGMRERIRDGDVDILVGTQILAKGHDFPNLNLVAVINADSALFSTDFRAAERLFALLTQVAGRAGRGERPGRVLIQTEFPGHPLYQALHDHDHAAFAETLLAERRQAGFPPYVFQALLRAEAPRADAAIEFLAQAARTGAGFAEAVTIYDPVPATLARLAGTDRAQLLVQADSRAALQRFLARWVDALREEGARRVRWSLDVDPQEF